MVAPAESNNNGVAFDIPIEKVKRNDKSPLSAIRKKLTAQANSPRPQASLGDINKKLADANKRKEANASSKMTAAHNAKVDEVMQKMQVETAKKSSRLEEELRTKLNDAEAKREGMTTNWMARLSASAKDKLKKANKAREEESWNQKELETNIDIKTIAADLRRSEQQLQIQEEQIRKNHDKISRGQLALKQTEFEAENRRAEIEEKLRSAEERREEALTGKVKQISSKMEKIQSAQQEIRKLEEERSKEKQLEVDTKTALAIQRREELESKRRDILLQSASKKEHAILNMRKEDEESALRKQKAICSKLQSAALRKEEALATKIKASQFEQERVNKKARNAWLEELKESKELQQTLDEKVKAAAERKNKIMKQKVETSEDVNKSKMERVEVLLKKNQQEENKRFLQSEQKLATAASNRKANLAAKSSSKKRMLSPRSSPTDKTELEDRINQAAERREIYLTSKVEKAKGGKESPVKKALFTSVSPMRTGNLRPRDMVRDSPRVKAARLAAFGGDGPQINHHSNQDDLVNDYAQTNNQGHALSLIAISGVAVVLVGLLSFLGHHQSTTK